VSSYGILRVSADGHEVVVHRPVEVTVGRGPEADLSVSHPLVSRRHVVLRPGAAGWILEDAGSTNGTYHDGKRVSLLQIDYPMRLRLGDPDGGAELQVEPVLGGAVPIRADSGGVLPDQPDQEAPRGRRALHPIAGQVRIGRAPDNDIVIRDPMVSGHHAELRGDPPHGLEILDTSSRNGTFVNGQRVLRAQLRERDRIGVGYHVYRVVRSGPADAPEYALEEHVDWGEWWKLAATVAISVMTVFGAGLALWAAYLSTRAVDGDRRTVLETVRVEQQRVAEDTQVRAEASFAARYRATLAEVEVLEREAAQARRRGKSAEAAELSDRAQVLRSDARNLRRFFSPDALRGKGARATFDVDARRRALARAAGRAQEEVAPLDPDRTAAQARELRMRSVRLQAWSIALVVVLAMLTFARLSEPVRPWLAVSGMVLFVVIEVAAILTVMS
jgi:pSer/pThr/pTyr-binding forkhead associated (FHA) protein